MNCLPVTNYGENTVISFLVLSHCSVPNNNGRWDLIMIFRQSVAFVCCMKKVFLLKIGAVYSF